MLLCDAIHSPPGGCAINLDLPAETLPSLVDMFRVHGDIFQVSAPELDNIFVLAHPDDVAHVLVRNYKNYPKGIGIDRLELLLGRGLMVTHGDEWKTQRKMLQPAFHRAQLGRYSIFINRCNRRVVDKWQAGLARGPLRIELNEMTSWLALQYTLFTLFGRDVDNLVDLYGSNPFLVVSEHTERDLELVRKFAPLREIILDLIERRELTSASERGPALDVLGILLAGVDTGPSVCTQDRASARARIAEQLMTLLVAGHETTASSLSSVWYLLAQHPEAAASVREEVDRVLGGRLPMFADVPSLTFTQQVIFEAMRLYPAAWLFTRTAREEDRLRQYRVPAGTEILLSPYLLHRHPAHWESPERFFPAHFALDRVDSRHRYAYIPFSAGPRNCIGDSLAMLEMTLHVSTLAQYFDLDLHEQDHGRAELSAKINLRWKSDIVMTVRGRNQE